jgi:hypothetical protein
MKHRLILSLMAAMLVAGCCKKKLYCQSGSLTVAFVGFTRTESRSVSIKRYERGTTDKAIDSGTFIYNGSQPVVAGKKDTLWLSEYQSSSYVFTGIKPANDWQIYLPFLRLNYHLKDMYDNGNRSTLVKCGDEETTCTAPMAHLVVNDYWMETDTLYIIKQTR